MTRLTQRRLTVHVTPRLAKHRQVRIVAMIPDQRDSEHDRQMDKAKSTPCIIIYKRQTTLGVFLSMWVSMHKHSNLPILLYFLCLLYMVLDDVFPVDFLVSQGGFLETSLVANLRPEQLIVSHWPPSFAHLQHGVTAKSSSPTKATTSSDYIKWT